MVPLFKGGSTKYLTQIHAAFKERFASGPQNWIISQQLATRKQVQGERIDDYIADVTRLCKRLKLSDADSMRYFIQGLQPHIQSYVTLARPKDFQEAESLARMKELVEINQNASDSRSILSQMEAMFTDLVTPQNDVVVLTVTCPRLIFRLSLVVGACPAISQKVTGLVLTFPLSWHFCCFLQWPRMSLVLNVLFCCCFALFSWLFFW